MKKNYSSCPISFNEDILVGIFPSDSKIALQIIFRADVASTHTRQSNNLPRHVLSDNYLFSRVIIKYRWRANCHVMLVIMTCLAFL